MTSHVGLMVVFALFVSVVFGTLMRDEPKEQLHFGARLFAAFVLGGALLGWILYPAPLKTRTLSLWGPVAIYMAAIFYVSSLHQAPLPPGVPDKPAHAFGYMGFGFVIARALAGGWPPRITLRDLLAGLAIAVAYGASDELHQRFVPGRSAELNDLYADAVGSAIALIACWAWSIIWPRSRHEL